MVIQPLADFSTVYQLRTTAKQLHIDGSTIYSTFTSFTEFMLKMKKLKSGNGYLYAVKDAESHSSRCLFSVSSSYFFLNPILLLSAPCPRFLSTHVLPPYVCVCVSGSALPARQGK